VDLSASVSSLALSCGWLPEANGKEPWLPVVADPHENPGFPSAPVRFLGVDPASLQKALTARRAERTDGVDGGRLGDPPKPGSSNLAENSPAPPIARPLPKKRWLI
jgi:hypothetical protein